MIMKGLVDRLFSNRFAGLISEKADNGRWEYVYKGRARHLKRSPCSKKGGIRCYDVSLYQMA